MNFLSLIPAQLLETTITNALLKGLTNPSQNKPFDPTPYQLYQMQQQQQLNNNFASFNNSISAPAAPPAPPAPPCPVAPPAPRIHNSTNIWY